jgi:exoribonuclease-2
MSFVARPGAVVAFWDGNRLAFGVVGGEEKERIRLVLPRGQELKVKGSRILLEVQPPAGVPGKGLEERRAAGERVTSIAERLGDQARTVDIALLWEIVAGEVEAEDGPLAVELKQLCQLALDDDGGEAQAALVTALLDDGLHFVRRGSTWEARALQAVVELRLERERVAERTTRTREFFERISEAVRGEPYRSPGTEIERRYLDALEQMAFHGLNTPEPVRAPALEVLTAAGIRFDRPHEGAFRLLRRVGRFESDDENLPRLRCRLSPEFSTKIHEAAARRAAAGPDGNDRLDLTDLEAISIDGPRTTEIDDLISLEPREGGSCRLGIHIADPSAFVLLGDPLDGEALDRAVTHYFPDGKIMMLPGEISENAASLAAGEDRPAMSFLVELDADGAVSDYIIRRSTVRSRGRLDYSGADQTLAAGAGPFAELLLAANSMATKRTACRIAAGAVSIQAPEIELWVDDEGQPRLERQPTVSPARRIVSEAMIVVGEVAARFSVDAEVPMIFRRQAAPEQRPTIPEGDVMDPVTVRSLRRSLRRAEASLYPGPHSGLGLTAYTQVTSPLRRYQDLAGHRQIVAVLAGEKPPYTREEMQRIMAVTNAADGEARRAERDCNEYWVLRYLEGHTGELVEAWVVAVTPRPLIQLAETLWEQSMPSLTGVEPGQTIQVRVERVNPRAGLVVLARPALSSGADSH